MSRRQFNFDDGKSRKFWTIELAGKRHTVRFGRIGTDGQEQAKDFPSEADARKSYDKLIAEKVKKGYTEDTAAGAGAAAGASSGEPAPAPPPPAKGKPVASPKVQPAGAEAKAAVAAPVPAAAVDMDASRRIDLEPTDVRVSGLVRPPPGAFDIEACARRVSRIKVGGYGWDWDFEQAGMPISMSPEEASYWLRAMSLTDKHTTPARVAEWAQTLCTENPAPIGFDEVKKIFHHVTRMATAGVFLPLANLLTFEELVKLFLDPDFPSKSDPRLGGNSLSGFRRYCLPYATNGQLNYLREQVKPRIDPASWPADFYMVPIAFHLAALAGMSEPLLAVVRSWKDDAYGASGWDHCYYHQPQIIVLGLGDPAVIEAEMRRLKLPLNRAEYVRAWLARTQYAALDYVRDSILGISNKDECEKMLEEFTRVKAPEAAPHMLQMRLESKAPKVARAWLDTNVGRAIAGLIPVAAGRGKIADAAIEHLMDLKRKGFEQAIRAALGDAPAERVRGEVLDRVEKEIPAFDAASTPEWLASAVEATPAKGKIPAWAEPEVLPPLIVKDHRLNRDQTVAVLRALQNDALGYPGPLLKELHVYSAPESIDAFAWRLFELWLSEGAPSKEKWAMASIGFLGGDVSALKLTPMIRNWPGESQHQRAVFGLECLRAIGSDTALMCLNGIAQKLKFKGLKTKATEFMDAIAGDRGMSRTELEDRIVPDCDLDERGTRVFDFGPRQFRFVLGPDMKPMIKDADGKTKSDLPAPNSKDDEQKATASVEAWKLLKKQVKEVARIQAERLEQAMVTGRRWTPKEFETLLVKHPLMINLVRLLLWGGYDAGQVIASFRVTEDQTYADQADEAFDPAGLKQIGIIHPMHLDEAARNAWGEVFSDYEIVPPFQQLGRPTYTLEPAEAEATAIKRFGTQKNIPATALVGTLERLAWVRGVPQDGGVFYEHTKPFPGANVTAVVQYDGVPVGYMEGWEDQAIEQCFFVPGIYTPHMYPKHADAVPLGKVDPVAVSEVLKDLMRIASKTK